MMTPSFTCTDTPLSSPHNHFINIYRGGTMTVVPHGCPCAHVHTIALKLCWVRLSFHTVLFRRRSHKHPHTPVIITISNYRRQGMSNGVRRPIPAQLWVSAFTNCNRKSFLFAVEIEFSWLGALIDRC